MASSFKWKRKRLLSLAAATGPSPLFSSDSEDDDNVPPHNKMIMLEDNVMASQRLQQQGVTLASDERYWEALKYWDEALVLTPNSAVLYEMKSQVFLELGEVFSAVQSAEKAVSLDNTWSIARQTLGRAQLGIGELKMALSSFQKGLHLDPTNNEIRDEDIRHTRSLLKQQQAMKSTNDDTV